MKELTIFDGPQLAENTRIAYVKQLKRYLNWCNAEQIEPLEADETTLQKYYLDLIQTGISVNTMDIAKSAIVKYFVLSGRKDDPHKTSTMTSFFRGLRRQHGKPPRRVRALTKNEILSMILACSDDLIQVRDAAVLAIGFAGALRRSEICALKFEDCEFFEKPKRMIITIRKSKTDVAGIGQKIAIPNGKYIRPVMRLQTWLIRSGIRSGPLFVSMNRGDYMNPQRPMHHTDVPRLVKKYATMIGLDASDIAGHSLRAGFVTSAISAGARIDKVMEVTRHTNPETLFKYIRHIDQFDSHAGTDVL